MTTLDATVIPTWRQYIAYKLAKTKPRTHALAPFMLFIRLALHLAGFGWLTFAGFTWNIIAGSIVAGVSCFALSALFTATATQQSESPKSAPDLRTGR